MSKIIFRESQRRELESNPNIIKGSDRSVSFSPEFKVKVVKENEQGKGATGRFSSKELSSEDKLKKAEARIAYLEAELDFVKKLEELERQAKKK